MLRALLRAAGRLREAGRLPSDWVDVVERCDKWRFSTHPSAWGMIEDFALQDLAGPGDSDGDHGSREDGDELDDCETGFADGEPGVDHDVIRGVQAEAGEGWTTVGIARMTL